MINIMYAVDPIKRIVKPMSGHAVTEQDHEASSLRFAFPDNIAGTGLDSTGTAVRVMYIRPDGGDPVAKTLTFYKHSGGYYLYDWDLQKSDLSKEGALVFSLCILDISGGEVSEWHTTPCAVRVLSTIHTDDLDEADETITPTVAQRVAVLESMIQRVASGAPIVVSSTSAMTDTEQIYILSTDGHWYYHNGTAWASGGEYGAVATDTTLTQANVPADAKAVGNSIQKNTDGLEYNSSVIDTTDYVAKYGVVAGRLGDDGQLINSSTWVTTEYIPVTLGDYKITSNQSGYTLFAAKYDAGKNLVSYTSMAVPDISFIYSVENDVSFVRLCVSKDLFLTYGFHFRIANNSNDLIRLSLKTVEENLIKSDNFINLLGFCGSTHGRLNSAGNITSSASFITTDFIRIYSGRTYKLYSENHTDFTVWIATYDNSKNLIVCNEGVSVQNGTLYYTAKDNETYIKISISKTVYNDSPYFVNAYVSEEITKTEVDKISTVLGTTDYIKTLSVSSGLLNTNGDIDNSFSWITTDYIPVVPGLAYALRCYGERTGYTLIRCIYDENKQLISRNEFVAEAPERLYIIPYGVKYVRFSVSDNVFDEGFSFGLLSDKLENPPAACVLEKNVYSYYGETPNVFAQNKYSCSQVWGYFDNVLPSGKTAQAIAIYNGVLFQFFADDEVRLYDYSSGAILADFEIRCGHANSATFSSDFYDPTDEFPLVYISDITGDVFVNRITRNSAELVKTIYCDESVYGYRPQMAINGSTAFVVGAKTTEEVATNPVYKISKINLSDLVKNNEKYTGLPIEGFEITVPGDKIVLQGIKFLNGELWLSSGGHSTRVHSAINIIQVAEEKVKTQITNFPETILLHELEDVDFVQSTELSKYDVILHVREHGYWKLVL